MTRPVSEHDQPHIRLLLETGGRTNIRLRAGRAQGTEPFYQLARSAHGYHRLFHPEHPPRTDQVLGDSDNLLSVDRQASFIMNFLPQ